MQTLEEQSISGDLLAAGNDVDGDSLNAQLISNPQFGTVVLNADGTFIYTPNALYRGTDTFNYQLNDGALSSAIAMVTITMAPVNHAPRVSSDDLPITLAEDGSATFGP